MEIKEILSMVGTLILMLAVFVGAYFVSKFVARRYSPKATASRNLSIIENLNIGKDKSIMVVKAAERLFLIGVTCHELSMLSELDPLDFPMTAEPKDQTKDFRTTLRDIITKGSRSAEGEKK